MKSEIKFLGFDKETTDFLDFIAEGGDESPPLKAL